MTGRGTTLDFQATPLWGEASSYLLFKRNINVTATHYVDWEINQLEGTMRDVLGTGPRLDEDLHRRLPAGAAAR